MLTDPIELDFSPSSWQAWTPRKLADKLDGVRGTWFVVGGWALDLHVGRITRPHEDLEIATPMWDFDHIRTRLAEYEFYVAGREGFWPLDGSGEHYFEYQQTYVRDPATQTWVLDVMRIPDDRSNTWICSADRSLRVPYDIAIRHTEDKIPYLAPELVLLFKALHTRTKDNQDFEEVRHHLTDQEQTALSGHLERLRGADHPWIPKLRGAL